MFIITPLRWFTLIGVLFWVIVYWQGGRKVIKDIQTSVKAEHSRLDTALMITIALFSLLIIGTGLRLSLGQLQMDLSQGWAATLGGCCLSALGIVGMFYCRHFLGRFWTAETTLLQGHQVVDKGPYGIVRHPIYTFAIVMYAGLGLVFPTPLSLLSVGAIVIAYALKAWDEDKFLERSLAGYHEYRQQVRYRLLPNLW